MKQLTCEMCGSTDLIKQDGVFVCQACGCKYSIEEARKMMVEGNVDVSGSTVKVDSSEKLKNILVLAKRARLEDNAEDAKKYYELALIEDPTNWESSFFSSYYNLLESPVGKLPDTLNKFNKRAITSLEIILPTYNGEEKENILDDFITSISQLYLIVSTHIQKEAKESDAKFISTLLQDALRTQSFGQTNNAYLKAQEDIRRNDIISSNRQEGQKFSTMLEAMQRTLFEICITIMQDDVDGRRRQIEDLLLKACDSLSGLQLSVGFTFIPDKLQFVAELIKVDCTMRKLNSEGRSESLLKLKELVEKNIASQEKDKKTSDTAYSENVQVRDAILDGIKRRKNEYWEEHKEEYEDLNHERQILLQEQESIQERVNELTLDISKVPSLEKQQSVKVRISDLKRQKDSLGLFKGKEKARIQQEIEALEKEDKDFARQVAEEQQPLKDELSSCQKQISEISRKLGAIEEELNKER